MPKKKGWCFSLCTKCPCSFSWDISQQTREGKKKRNIMKLSVGAARCLSGRGKRIGLFIGLIAGIGLLEAQQAFGVVVGNINPLAIEIDRPSANLYPSNNTGFVDWVKDSLTNSDAPSLINSIATGLTPNVTSAPGGKGHWNGVRIVDGIGGAEKDIFLNGGKENDTTTWSVGAGSVGSAKYDITQAYLANNNSTLFFGMERRGNNGTTAFDFEFNQLPPTGLYLPTRSIGDVLFTFEMQGSGGSGSAVPHFFRWNGTKFEEQNPAPSSLVSSINQADIPAAPWGYVDSKGNWGLGSIPRFEFAEASVDLVQTFPNFVPCNTKAFVQVRTRSSATDTSDLKDTTKFFEFSFGGPTPAAALATSCSPQFTYDAAGSTDSSGGTNSLNYSWDFLPPTGVTLSGTGVTGPDGDGAYHSTLGSGLVSASLGSATSATIGVQLTVSESPTCSNTLNELSITLANSLVASITNKEMHGLTLSVTLSGSAPGATGFQWQRQSGTNWVNISGATSSTLNYSSFESDTTATIQNFDIGTVPYQGQLFEVFVRLTASRTNGAFTCSAISDPLSLKKIIGVDP
jgi:hypothetical protein